MRVLVVESDRHAADRAVADLRARGHRVVRCHDADLPAFPCSALCESGVCALDRGGRVDVVLDYRAHPHADPTGYEDGASCALRRRIPLVVGGATTPNPFGGWVSAVASDDEVVDVCEAVAAPSTDRLNEVARRKVLEVLGAEPGASVHVTRDRGALEVVITLPDSAADVDGATAVAIVGALRRHDRLVPQIDVVVKRKDHSNRWTFPKTSAGA